MIIICVVKHLFLVNMLALSRVQSGAGFMVFAFKWLVWFFPFVVSYFSRYFQRVRTVGLLYLSSLSFSEYTYNIYISICIHIHDTYIHTHINVNVCVCRTENSGKLWICKKINWKSTIPATLIIVLLHTQTRHSIYIYFFIFDD